MKFMRIGALSIAILSTFPASVMANQSVKYMGSIEVQGMRAMAPAPSTFTEWEDVSQPYDHTQWLPTTESQVAIYEGELGVVWEDSAEDVPVPDFTQSRDYKVDQERLEQQHRVDENTGEVIPVDQPIRHTRVDDRTEERIVEALNGQWTNLNAEPTCAEWEQTPGYNSPLLTPTTESSEERRHCIIPQEKQIAFDEDGTMYEFEQTREFHYYETRNFQGQMTNQSCKAVKDYYNANQAAINAEDPSFHYNGYNQISINSSITYEAYCSDGWTMVTAQRPNTPVAWTGEGHQYDLEAKWGTGYSLPQSWIPAHGQWAVGENHSITIAFDSGSYSTGNIDTTLYSNGHGYRVHRNTGAHFRWHNPWSGSSTEAQYNNTLTVEDIGGWWDSNYRWAFSPNAAASCTRGYALSGPRFTDYGNSAWTIWVR